MLKKKAKFDIFLTFVLTDQNCHGKRYHKGRSVDQQEEVRSGTLEHLMFDLEFLPDDP